MLLSELLPEMGIRQYEIVNEQPFTWLALIVQNPGAPYCTFVESEKYIGSVGGQASMVITTPELKDTLAGNGYGVCAVESPRELYFRLHVFLCGREGYVRKQFKTKIGKNCNISPQSSIAENNVEIGDNVTIEEFAVIRSNTVIGDNAIVRAGAKIGGDGYETKLFDGNQTLICHAGGVILGQHAQVMYNACVDKALYPWDDTVLGDYTIIDNLTHVGHGSKLGKNVGMAAGAILGGRTVCEDGAYIGPFSTTLPGIRVGKNARVSLGSVATKNVPDGQTVTGNFAIPHERFIQNLKKSVEE